MAKKKSPFGSYAVIENVRFNFADESEYWWEIKPPTAGDELALTRYMNTGKAIYNADGGMETEGSPSWLDILFYEIALLFGGTNIPADPDKPVSDDGKPFISENSATSVIEAKLKTMPMEMIAEIADKIAEHVPGWGPKNPLSRTNQEED
jgi:hypothetical protein